MPFGPAVSTISPLRQNLTTLVWDRTTTDRRLDNRNSSARKRTKGEHGNCRIPQFGVGIRLSFSYHHKAEALYVMTGCNYQEWGSHYCYVTFLYAPLAPTLLKLLFNPSILIAVNLFAQ